MTRSELVREFQASSRGVVVRARRDLEAFWASLNLDRPEAARDALLRFVPLLTSRYGGAAAVVAANFYDDLRLVERVPPGFRARMAETVPAEAVQAQVRFSAQHLFTEDPGQALAFLLGEVATKYVLQPARDTITQSAAADPSASGWHRETRSSQAYTSGCDFCRMLAGRGGVYKDSTARFAAHGDCRCVAVPSWDATAPEVDVLAYRLSERTASMSPEALERRNDLVRDWIARNQ